MHSIQPLRKPKQEHEVWHLGKAKVAQLDEALEVYEDILGLEVAVDNVVVVQVLQSQHYAANVELGQALVHALQHLHLHPTCKAFTQPLMQSLVEAFVEAFVQAFVSSFMQCCLQSVMWSLACNDSC